MYLYGKTINPVAKPDKTQPIDPMEPQEPISIFFFFIL